MSSTTATPTAPSTITKPKIEKLSDIDVHNENTDDKDRGWLVRLYNDPMNKREFVARCLAEVCGIDDGASYMIMMKAHQTGLAVIGNYHRELAELYKTKLSSEGLLIDMVPADDE
jgi:ATP-dependent Clp protease adapter protein ClpS